MDVELSNGIRTGDAGVGVAAYRQRTNKGVGMVGRQLQDWEVCGVTEEQFDRRLARTGSELRAAVATAEEKDRPAPTQRRCRFKVAPWGWVDAIVSLGYDDDGPINAYRIAAIGVVSPDLHPSRIRIIAAANDKNPPGPVLRPAAYGTGGILGGVCGGLGLPAHWAQYAVIGAAAGIGATAGHLRNRWIHSDLSHSVRVPEESLDFSQVWDAAAALMAVRDEQTQFRAGMAKAAKHDKLTPLPVPAETLTAEVDITLALWDLAGPDYNTTRERDQLAAGIQELAIETICRLREEWAGYLEVAGMIGWDDTTPDPDTDLVAPAPPAAVEDLRARADLIRSTRTAAHPCSGRPRAGQRSAGRSARVDQGQRKIFWRSLDKFGAQPRCIQ